MGRAANRRKARLLREETHSNSVDQERTEEKPYARKSSDNTAMAPLAWFSATHPPIPHRRACLRTPGCYHYHSPLSISYPLEQLMEG